MKKIRFIFKRAVLIGMAALMCPYFTACDSLPDGYTVTENDFITNDNSTAMVVLLGKHANAMEIPQDAYDQIEDMLDNVVYGGYVCAVIVDGDPDKIDLVEDNDFFEENARNSSKLNTILEKRKAEIVDSLENMPEVADDEEVDLLAAIREAANVLSGSVAANAVNKRIVIVDTGISTTGDLNLINADFSDNNKPDAIKDIIPTLKERGGVNVLPDLSGIDVTFIGTVDGLAEAAAPQEMETTDKIYIKELWKAVIEACNAETPEFKAAAGWDVVNDYTEDEDSKFKRVTSIIFTNPSIYIEGSDDDSNPDSLPDLPNPPPIEINLPTETINFKSGTSEYSEPEITENYTLRPYAEQLITHFDSYPEDTVWIAGTTAGEDQDDGVDQSLSQDRAEAVKKSLVKLGVPEENLVTIALGCEFPWKTKETNNSDKEKNRTVVIFSETESSAAGSQNYYKQLKEAYAKGELMDDTMVRFAELSK